jgi:ribosomal protein L40E
MLRFILLAFGFIFLFSLLARAMRRFRSMLRGVVICPHCSARNPSDAKVCRSCGRHLYRESRVPEYTVED